MSNNLNPRAKIGDEGKRLLGFECYCGYNIPHEELVLNMNVDRHSPRNKGKSLEEMVDSEYFLCPKCTRVVIQDHIYVQRPIYSTSSKT